MKFLLVLLGALYAAAEDATFNESSKFIRHYRKYKNDAIHPCDDFYRHICPEEIDEKEIILKTSYLVGESEARKIIEDLFENNTDLLRFKDHVNELCWNFSARAETNKPEDSIKFLFIPMLEKRVAMLLSFSSEHTLTAEEHSELAKDVEEFRKVVVEQVKRSDYPSDVQKELLDTLNELMVHLGFKGERIATEQSYKAWPTVMIYNETITRLYDKYGKNFEPGLPNDELLQELRELHEWFDIINPEYVGRVTMTGRVNAFYIPEGNILTIPEARMLLARNSPPAIKAGSIMRTIGHEIHHGLFNAYLAIEKEDKYIKRRTCLENHMENVCQEYEPHCHSGNKTFYEDSADLEGIQGAILWLQKKLGDDYRKPIIDNTTNEQMFFYAYAAGLCDNEVFSEDVHSISMARVNGPLSLSPTFREAFQCEDEHKMMKLAAVAPDNCNFFGEALR